MQRLLAYEWPGNIRELRNVVERSVILSTGRTLDIDAALGASLPRVACTEPDSSDELLTLVEMEKQHILAALKRTTGVVEGPNGAAQLLGINANTLRSRMRKSNISPRRPDK